MAEQGYPDYEQSAWSALIAPAGTPPAAVARLNAALNQALRSENVEKELRSRSQEPLGGTPQDVQTPDSQGAAQMGDHHQGRHPGLTPMNTDTGAAAWSA